MQGISDLTFRRIFKLLLFHAEHAEEQRSQRRISYLIYFSLPFSDLVLLASDLFVFCDLVLDALFRVVSRKARNGAAAQRRMPFCYTNALNPVMALPTIRELISLVPS